MEKYEKLIREVTKEVKVVECDIKSILGDTGYYRDGVIYIEKTLPTKKKTERLYEEYSHHKTTVGIILDQTNGNNRKQEQKARTFGQTLAITLEVILECYKSGIKYYWECAEYLGLSEDFVRSAIQQLQNKFGQTAQHGDYIIHFVPETRIEIECN
ncbi:toxin [Erwinia sp. CPCC 100877]|nr:toxin [Erwinia sp. CPCC 100877]